MDGSTTPLVEETGQRAATTLLAALLRRPIRQVDGASAGRHWHRHC
jgi:hypothetical protein